MWTRHHRSHERQRLFAQRRVLATQAQQIEAQRTTAAAAIVLLEQRGTNLPPISFASEQAALTKAEAEAVAFQRAVEIQRQRVASIALLVSSSESLVSWESDALNSRNAKLETRNLITAHETAKLTQVQQKKLWTCWLNADGLNPLAIGLRMARNLAGGGERAAAKLELAQRAARRAELETNLRQRVAQALTNYEAAEQQQTFLHAKLAAQRVRVQLAEAAYRLGEGSSDTMWQLWFTRDELQAQLVWAQRQHQQAKAHLARLVFPRL